MSETVCVVGLGYVGLPTAAVLAGQGLRVIGVDVRPEVVKAVNEGAPHIREPGLKVLVNAAVKSGNLRAVSAPESADVFIVAVPTPLTEGYKPDVKHVREAALAIAPVLAPGNLVILESTSPVGTTERLASWLGDARPDLTFPHQVGQDADVHIAYCPERVLPGNILRELVENDRVIGAMTPACGEKAATYYRRFVQGQCFVTDARTAEMVKLVENAYRDVNIGFANELSIICDKLGISVWKVIALANRHPRVNILSPGPGVGGHCIAIDPWFIVDAAPAEARLIRLAREVNSQKPRYVVQTTRRLLSQVKFPTIACLGLAYKPNVGDLRESPAVEVVRELASEGLGVLLVVEPYVDSLPSALTDLPGIELTDLETALSRANVVLALVAHKEFSRIDPCLLEGKTVIDTCGLWVGDWSVHQ